MIKEHYTGIPWQNIENYIMSEVLTTPGIAQFKDHILIVLTGSRALGKFTKYSDLDFEIICEEHINRNIIKILQEHTIIENALQTFFYLEHDHYRSYFGEDVSAPHFSLLDVNHIIKQLEHYEDIPLWIWSHAQYVYGNKSLFSQIKAHKDFPLPVLHQKIKYRYLYHL
jgi:hypothetical protein